MAVEYITSRNLADLIYETVRLMNRTMAHHGMRVSYIMAKMLETQGTSAASVEQPVLDSLMLAQALGQISDRERYIFFARALEKRSFDDLAAELGMGYKGVAAAYYRAVQKLKKEM